MLNIKIIDKKSDLNYKASITIHSSSWIIHLSYLYGIVSFKSPLMEK